MIYKAEVEEDNSPDNVKQYVGLASTTFKARFTNHKVDLNNKGRDGTELSDHDN